MGTLVLDWRFDLSAETPSDGIKDISNDSLPHLTLRVIDMVVMVGNTFDIDNSNGKFYYYVGFAFHRRRQKR